MRRLTAVLFHVLGHVEAQEVDTEKSGQLLGQLGLADAGRAGEQERADGASLGGPGRRGPA